MPDGFVRLKGCARNGACASGLSGRRCSTSRECTICVFSASNATTIEMPMLPPTLRIRLKTAVPCVRMLRGRVEKVTVLSGVNTKPSPKPCSNPEVMIGPIPICIVKPVICHSAATVSTSPVRMIRRVSTRPTSRAQRIIAIIVPTPRGAVTKPVVMTG